MINDIIDIKKTVKWKYASRVVKEEVYAPNYIDKILEDMGNNGWELVSMTASYSGNHYHVAVFKKLSYE